jgi:hypothetical protein
VRVVNAAHKVRHARVAADEGAHFTFAGDSFAHVAGSVLLASEPDLDPVDA